MPQHFGIPSIKENLEKQKRNAGDNVDFEHVTTRAKQRKRNHNPDRAFDGQCVASRPSIRSGLDAKAHPNTRNQYAQTSANLAEIKQGPAAGDQMNAARHHEREGIQHPERDYISIDDLVENSASSNDVGLTLRAQLAHC